MSYDQELSGRVRKIIHEEKGFSERQMFGGVGFMLHGNMCCGVNQTNLIVRVGLEAYDASLSENNVKVFDMTGRPMRGWVVVEPRGITDESNLQAWVGRGVSFARSLPPKSS